MTEWSLFLASGMQAGLRSPLLLLTLLAAFIPIVIHLLSRSRGRLVPFAHTPLIKKLKQKRMTQIRLVERLLLALRLMLLLLASLLLAELFWSGQWSKQRQILVTEDWLIHASDDDKRQLADNMTDTDVVVIGGPRSELTQSQLLNWVPTRGSAKTINLWQHIKVYSLTISPDMPLVVYTTNRLNQFDGDKVVLPNPIDWQVKLLEFNVYPEEIAKHRILVFSERNRQMDLTYLDAAFNAMNAEKQLELNPRFFTLASPQQPVNQADTLFYLSDSPVPASLLSMVNDGALLVIDNVAPDNMVEEGDILLLTNAARPLLSRIKHGNGQILRLHTRFHPDWSEWVVQPEFPLQLAGQLFEQQSTRSQRKNGRLSEAQIEALPSATGDRRQTILPLNKHFLEGWLVFLMTLVFIAERFLSEWSKSRFAKPTLGRESVNEG